MSVILDKRMVAESERRDAETAVKDILQEAVASGHMGPIRVDPSYFLFEAQPGSYAHRFGSVLPCQDRVYRSVMLSLIINRPFWGLDRCGRWRAGGDDGVLLELEPDVDLTLQRHRLHRRPRHHRRVPGRLHHPQSVGQEEVLHHQGAF